MWKSASAEGVVRMIGRCLFTALVLSFVSTLIGSIAGVAGRTRLIDLTGVLVERPFWMLVFGWWAAWIVRRLHALSWEQAIQRILRVAPLALLIPLVNVVVAWLGLESLVPSFVNVLEVPVSLLTFGWLPRFLASSGVLVFLVVSAVVLMIEAWSAKRSVKQIVIATLLWFGGTLGLLLTPSVLSWVLLPAGVSSLNAGPNVLSRVWVAVAQESYWWRSLMDRFPGILEGEAEASVRLLQLVLAWLVVVVTEAILFFRQVSFSRQQLFAWFKPVRGVSFLATAFFGMWIGQVFDGQFVTRAVDILALLLYIVTLLAVWGVSVWRNDLHDLEQDRLTGRLDRPLAKGDLRLTEFAWLGKTLLLIAGVSGWLLGWPVLLPLLGFLLLQEGLSLSSLRWKERVFGGLLLALACVCVTVSGVFFSLRTAAVPILSASIWLTIAFFYLFQAFPKALRWSPNLLEWLATHVRISPRLLIPIALALSYLLVPLLSGWVVLWWIALPCAIVALLPLFGSGRWDERKIVGWQTAFLIIAFLLLSVRPSP